jgi:hypothetical protein
MLLFGTDRMGQGRLVQRSATLTCKKELSIAMTRLIYIGSSGWETEIFQYENGRPKVEEEGETDSWRNQNPIGDVKAPFTCVAF